MSSIHINNVGFFVFLLSAEMGLDLQPKATSAMQTLFTQVVPHIYSLQKERWLHYMYRVTQKSGSMYTIYRFPIWNNTIDVYNFFFFFTPPLTKAHGRIHTASYTVVVGHLLDSSARDVFFFFFPFPSRQRGKLSCLARQNSWRGNNLGTIPV